MPFPPPSLRAAALAVLPLALAACRSDPTPPAAPTAAAQASPAASFLRTPAVSHVALSPDGKRIAGLSSREGVRVVFEGSRTSLREVNHLTKIEPETLVQSFGWSGDGVLVVGYEQPNASTEREIQNRRSAEGIVYNVDSVRARRPQRTREHRMVALRLSTWRQPGDTSWPLEVHPSLPGGVIHWLPEDPERVLINWWPSSEVGASAVLARVRDGFPKEVVRAAPGMDAWYADHQGRVRAGSGRSEDGINAIVVARADDRAPFEELAGAGISEATDFEFAGFDADPNIIYVTAIGSRGRKELFAYDLAKRIRRAVHADDRFDVGPLVNSPRDGALWAVEVDAEKPELHFFDRTAERDQASIDKALPDTTNRVVSVDRDMRFGIVLASSDTNPPDYYLYDRARRRMDFLFTGNPMLDRTQLAPMKPVQYTARDGLPISGYLTVPRGAAAKNLPVIVIVHDGPSARVRWGWDPVVQFLASRGFAVFQPNYRGSTGYGRDHERMGYGQWGLAMQEDLVDGVRWLVAEGIANPTRVGIYGVGYGGYAALLAATRPQMFRAAASYGAVTDLTQLLDDPTAYRTTDLNNPVEGKLPGDRAALAALSPAQLAAQIRIPVLVGHGLADPVVNAEQGRAMVDAIEDAGGNVESAFYRDELHELVEEADRVEFHEKLAAFFARHLAVESL